MVSHKNCLPFIKLLPTSGRTSIKTIDLIFGFGLFVLFEKDCNHTRQCAAPDLELLMLLLFIKGIKPLAFGVLDCAEAVDFV